MYFLNSAVMSDILELRQHGLQDNTHISISLIQITSIEHCTELLLECATQNFLFMLILFSHCARMWKPAKIWTRSDQFFHNYLMSSLYLWIRWRTKISCLL